MRVELAAAPVIAELRRELLVAPDERVVTAHLEMMQLERQFVTRPPAPKRPRRRANATPSTRRVTCVVAALSLTFATCALDAAGALPEPLGHIARITHAIEHFGVPTQLPDLVHPTNPFVGSAAPERVDRQEAAGTPAPASPGLNTEAAAGMLPAPDAPASLSAPTGAPTAPTGGGESTRPPSSQPPPKKNRESHGTPPPGLPANWQAVTMAQARAALRACVQSTDAAPTGCPQQLGAPTPATTVEWRLVGAPLAGAVATVHLPRSTQGSHGEGTEVTVYGRYQIVGQYTVPGGAPQIAYSGGIALATLTWDGHAFPSVVFTEGSIDPPLGVRISGFSRPADGDDAALLSLVHDGFEKCTATPASATDATVPGCPQQAAVPPGATNLIWQLNGDPLAGASVAFDARTGTFRVTGGYAMTLLADGAPGATVAGDYTATIVFDGQALRLIGIAART
jgi:hypothetical protein